MYIDKVEEFAKKIYGVKVTNNPLTNPMYEFTGTELAMFAELIVRECTELTLDHKSDDYYNGWLDYRDEIKKHFGVE